MNQTNWKEQDSWGIKEFILLMFLEFVIVIGVVKAFVPSIYERWFEDELFSGTLLGLTIAVILLLGVYFIALRPQQLSWSEVGLQRFAAKDWKLIIIYSIILFVGAILIVILTSFIGNSWENEKTDAMQQDITFTTVLIAFISAAIISPIYEEIFYRGFLYRWFRTRVGLIWAVLLSSAIFTIAHIPTYNTMPVNFFSAIIFALAYERTNSVWPAIIIHGLTNGIMVLLTTLG
jgi:hypothetical protein